MLIFFKKFMLSSPMSASVVMAYHYRDVTVFQPKGLLVAEGTKY